VSRLRAHPGRGRAAHLRLGYAFESNPLGALAGCLRRAAVLGLVQWAFRLSCLSQLSPGEARTTRAAVALVANYAFVIVQTRLGWR
jgi:hypothetical protein